jgi:hypothetical protein
MIQGLRVDIPSGVLASHLETRRKHHLERAAHHKAQLAKTDDKRLRVGSSRSADGHAEKAEYYRIFARYLVPGEDYRLDYHDLLCIEMLRDDDDLSF